MMKIVTKHFQTLPSTNLYCKENLSPKANEIYVITADMQSAGKGQYGRSWYSPESKNIYMSFCFLTDSTSSPICISQIFSLVICDVLKRFSVISEIKWPNDVLVSEKKISGILTEIIGNKCIVGIGLNLFMDDQDLSKIDQKATSLNMETNQTITTASVESMLIEKGKEYLMIFKKQGFAPFVSSYKKLLKDFGKTVTWTITNQIVTGTLSEIDDSGILYLVDHEGREHKVFSGSIKACD